MQSQATIYVSEVKFFVVLVLFALKSYLEIDRYVGVSQVVVDHGGLALDILELDLLVKLAVFCLLFEKGYQVDGHYLFLWKLVAVGVDPVREWSRFVFDNILYLYYILREKGG